MKGNNKTLLIILGVLIVIAVIYYFRDRQIERADEIFMTCDSSKITEVRVKAKEGNVLLKREGTQWRMKEPKDVEVQQWAIQQLLKSFDTLEVEYVVSEEPAKFKDYQVDDSTGAHVTVKTVGNKTYELIIGSLGPTWRHTHMRKAGEKKVYLVKGAIRSNVVKSPDDWRDRKVYVFSADSCESFGATFPDKKSSYGLAREDSAWVLTPAVGKKFKPDQMATEAVLNGILRISIGEFVPDSVLRLINYNEELARFDFQMKDMKKHDIEFYNYPNNEQKIIFKADGSAEPYVTWKATYDVVNKKAEELNPEFVKKKRAREEAGMKKAKEVVGKDLKKRAAAKKAK